MLSEEQKKYIEKVVYDQNGFYTIKDLATRINQEEWMQSASNDDVLKEVKKHEIERLQMVD